MEQITIPDFDDDDSYVTPGLFGKPQNAGNAFGSFAFGQGSPTTTPMPLPERSGGSYFHARNDSVNSEDSTHSASAFSPPSKSTKSSNYQAQPAIAGPSATRKSSLASLRNAFTKGAKASEPPPLPPLKNPFNRSASSIALSAQSSSNRRPSTATTIQTTSTRPPTPGSSDSRYARTLSSKPKSHQYARSHHSQTGSVFHGSDSGADFGHAFGHRTASPPPVPPMPSGLSQRPEPTAEYEEDPVALDPRTPSDYALHAVFMRFAASAEGKIDAFLREPLDREPSLTDMLGPGVDTKFDDLLSSLGKIAQKHSKPVVDSVMRWRKSQSEGVSADIIRMHANRRSHMPSRSVNYQAGARSQPQDKPALLQHRKILASIYVMCRALIHVVQAISAAGGKDGLSEATGYVLEETTFEQLRKPDLKLLAQSANHRTNAELYAKLLGDLADVRFISVTDRFLVELEPVAQGQVLKDMDMRYETLVRGLKHIRVQVYPPEKFEEGAEFLESLSKAFDNAHGFSLKSAFAETLTHLLHPIGKTAQAEVNHPLWAKAIEVIYPKARDMMTKPRYWHVAYPLVVTSLCVAPHDYFLKNWMFCFEAGLAKLKDKPFRLPVMNGMMRLIWTYLYRCQEPMSATTVKLDQLLKNFFPATRLAVYPPPDDILDPFVYIVHYVLSRHHEFGSDIVLDLLQENAVSAGGSATSLANLVSSDRVAIAVRAVLLTLHGLENEEPIPSWPSCSDFNTLPPAEDYPSSAGFVPVSLTTSRPGVQDLLDRLQPLLSKIALWCRSSVGRMTIFEDQWALAHTTITYEDSSNYVIRRHPEGSVAYPAQLSPQIAMLQTCFRGWPRLLDGNVPLNDALDMLICGIVHVEPDVADSATLALRRFMDDPERATGLLSRYAEFLFEVVHKTREGPGVRFVLESGRLANNWASLLDSWIHAFLQGPPDVLDEAQRKALTARMDEIEAGAFFLMTFDPWPIHSVGVKVLRMLIYLTEQLGKITPGSADSSEGSNKPRRIVDLFTGVGPARSCLEGYDYLEQADIDRLDQWKNTSHPDVLLRIADSKSTRDRALWRTVYPRILKTSAEYPLRPLSRLRDMVIAAASRYLPFMGVIAGLKSKASTTSQARPLVPPEKDGRKALPELTPAMNQWIMWMQIICCVTSPSDLRPGGWQREHARALSDFSAEREMMMTCRGLYRCLLPFLDSDLTAFRSGVAICISSLPTQYFPQLLEDLSLLAGRQFFDESRSKTGFSLRTSRQEELYTAVARIYFMTAPFLQDPRSPGRQAALAHVLKFVRNTQIFLSSPDARDRYQLQRLRRYFCGTVERLFDGLATLKDSDRFIPTNIHVSLYRLCEEWCQSGTQSAVVKQRLIVMQTNAASAPGAPHATADAIERFQIQTKKLSKAAVGTLASLCHKAYFPPDLSSGSPTERSQDHLRPLDASSTLDRLTAILASHDESLHPSGRKALRLLLSHVQVDATLADEALRRAFVTTSDADTSNGRFFEVVAEVISTTEQHAFTFSQAVCLGLSNLCHPLVQVRRNAFRVIETIQSRSTAMVSIAQYEAGIRSSSPGTYLHVYRMLSGALAQEHTRQATSLVTQIANWLPQISEGAHGRLSLLLLQSLEQWVANIDLMTDESELSHEGANVLCQMMALTLRYVDAYAEQIQMLWSRLVSPPHDSNGHATIRFLLEQSQKVGSAAYAGCASKVVACLCGSSIGRQIFDDLCSIIDPIRMLQNVEHKLKFPTPEDTAIWSTLDALFGEQPRLQLGTAQFALLFLSDVALERPWEMERHLPLILHVAIMHVDNRNIFVQQRTRHIIMQVLRLWLPLYEDLDTISQTDRVAARVAVLNLEEKMAGKLWKEDDSSDETLPKMKTLCSEVLAVLGPLCPDLAERWGSLALSWATGCAVRAIAFRSLQVFRAIMPAISKDDLGIIIGRLSVTISGSEEQLQSYTVEIILALTGLAQSPRMDVAALPQLFWCACACLLTTVEREFVHAVSLVEALLSTVDLNDPNMADLLLSHRPSDWIGSASLQRSLLSGLRSSTTFAATFDLLRRLTTINDDQLVDPSEDRVRDLYTLVLPWCLRDMTSNNRDINLQEFAERIGQLAELEDRPSIGRIMVSFAKSRFRTKDDFLRQSVLSLKEHYGADHWGDIVTLLVGMLLNGERWMRLYTLQILKVLFQQKTAQNPVDLLGSELLMPLLRLVESDVATEALAVLDEPMTISGGPKAKHVLRMSMPLHARAAVVDPEASVFGIPEDSGWCIARVDKARATCRANVEAVFDTCKMNLRPSRIHFEPELEPLDVHVQDEVGDLVHDLHELSSFFTDAPRGPSMVLPTHAPSQQSVAKWAAILAKSRDDPEDIPPTPFVDIFRVDGASEYSDPSDDSGSDTESDHFIFDSPAYHRGHTSTSSHH